MATRSRRSSTMASSMATQDLARQRTVMYSEAAARYQTRKRNVSRPGREMEPKPKKPRRPRRWAPPGWDGTRWSARSIHPGGLETHHEPCMSSFISVEATSSETSTASTGSFSWLRPRNSVSVWEHLAEVHRQADNISTSAATITVNASLPALASDVGVGTGDGPTTRALHRSQSSARADGALDAVAAQYEGASPPDCAMGDRGGNVSTDLVVAMPKPTHVPSSSCAPSSSVAEAGSPDVVVPKTPAVTCSVDRMSIVSLVNGL